MIRRVMELKSVVPGEPLRAWFEGDAGGLMAKITPQESAELVPGTNYRVDISSVPSGKEE